MSDTSKVNEVLEEVKSSDDSLARSKAISLLEDPYIQYETIDVRKGISVDKNSSYVNGCIYFLSFCETASDYFATKDEVIKNECNKRIQNSSTLDFLESYYNLPSYLPDNEECYELHEVGTTSYIIHITRKDQDDLALKIVKPRYLDNPTICERTSSYKNKYEDIEEVSVYVKESTKRYILMEYVDGKTLSYYIKEEFSNLKPEKRLKYARLILDEVIKALEYALEHDISHYDISPDNVLIEEINLEGENPKVSLRLIDFGFNYLVLDRVGSAHAFGSVQTYIAPELAKDPGSVSVRSDVYGVGILSAEVLSGKLVGEESLPSLLDTCWNHYPEIAKYIEPLVQEDPKDRMKSFEGFAESSDTNVFSKLRECYSRALLLSSERHSAEEWSSKIPQAITLFLLVGAGQLLPYIKKALSISDEDKSLDYSSRYLLSWAILPEVLYLVTFLVVALLIMRDFGLGGTIGIPIVAKVLDVLPGPAGMEYVLPRLLGLSCGMAAVKYYLYIFINVDARGVSPMMETSVRLISFIWTFPLIWGVFWGPSHWGLFAGVGILLFSFNNLVCYTVSAKIYNSDANHLFLESSNIYEFIRLFKWWFPSMFIYGFILLVIWILLEWNVLVDNTFYLVVCLGINFFYLYYQMLSDYGPTIRQGLTRTISFYRDLNPTKHSF